MCRGIIDVGSRRLGFRDVWLVDWVSMEERDGGAENGVLLMLVSNAEIGR